MSTNPETTVIPAGEGTVALHIPAKLADATIGGTRIVNMTSGWATPTCVCHDSETAPAGGYIVCRLDRIGGEPVHLAKTVVDGRSRYARALEIKRSQVFPELCVIYSAYACGHYIY